MKYLLKTFSLYFILNTVLAKTHFDAFSLSTCSYLN